MLKELFIQYCAPFISYIRPGLSTWYCEPFANLYAPNVFKMLVTKLLD